MIESEDTLVSEPIPHADTAPTNLTSDERWAQWKEKGARQAARSARAMKMIWLIAALALAIGFIWAFASR
jgi:hypothetical protein